jgi:hypothetical protein
MTTDLSITTVVFGQQLRRHIRWNILSLPEAAVAGRTLAAVAGLVAIARQL